MSACRCVSSAPSSCSSTYVAIAAPVRLGSSDGDRRDRPPLGHRQCERRPRVDGEDDRAAPRASSSGGPSFRADPGHREIDELLFPRRRPRPLGACLLLGVPRSG
ncbi:hypothetical protein ACFPRL_05900 [Pseudoclavibacter helvolus]